LGKHFRRGNMVAVCLVIDEERLHDIMCNVLEKGYRDDLKNTEVLIQ